MRGLLDKLVNRLKNSIKLVPFIIIIVTLLVNPIQLYAKSPKSALKDLRKKYQKVETLQADFLEIYEWAHTGEKIQRSGKIILAAGQRFRIDTEEQLIVCDNVSVYRHNKIKSQVIIEPIANNEENLLPRRMLLNFADEFKADKYMELPVKDKLGFRLDLISKNPNEMLIASATLWVTKEDKTIRRFMFADINGNITTYYLSNILLDMQIDSTLTSFEIPSDVEIFDLR